MRRPQARHVGLAALAVATLVIPLGLSNSALSVYVLLGLAAVVTIGLSLLMGYAGQVSLGQAAFYAIGGYTAALVSVHGGPTLVGLAAAPVVAAVVASVVGIPLLRLRGHYLAFATLAFQLIVVAVIGDAASFTGGDIGLRGIPQLGIGSVRLTSNLGYAYVVWVAVAVVLLISRNVIRSRPGRGLRALATSEPAAEAAGVPVGRYKLAIFSLSAAFAGVAGGVYAFFLGYLAPGSFPILLSFEYVIMAAVGGLGTIFGPLLGAALITVVVQVLNNVGASGGLPSYAPAVFSDAVYAVLLIVVVLFLPEGVFPALARIARATGRRLSGREEAGGATGIAPPVGAAAPAAGTADGVTRAAARRGRT